MSWLDAVSRYGVSQHRTELDEHYFISTHGPGRARKGSSGSRKGE